MAALIAIYALGIILIIIGTKKDDERMKKEMEEKTKD